MRLLSFCCAGAILAALAGLFPTATLAAFAQRTFVSVNGSDANPCSVAAPCRSFDVALANTVAGGEIVAVDSGGFGTMSITKSIQIIVPPGVHAAIFAASGNAVTVNASAGDVVVLRGLYINSQGATNGIYVLGVGSLQLEGVTVNGFINGVWIQAGANVAISGSIVRNNSGTGVYGIAFSPARLVIERSTFTGNGFGVYVAGLQPSATIRDSVFSGQTQSAIDLYPTVLPAVGTIFVERCTVIENSFGIESRVNAGAGNSATIYVSGSTIARNGTGIFAGGGGAAQVVSRGDNTLEQNVLGNAFSTTFLPK